MAGTTVRASVHVGDESCLNVTKFADGTLHVSVDFQSLSMVFADSEHLGQFASLLLAAATDSDEMDVPGDGDGPRCVAVMYDGKSKRPTGPQDAGDQNDLAYVALCEAAGF